MLQVRHPDTELPIHDIEIDATGENDATSPVKLAQSFPQPDWSLISFQGLLGVLQLAVSVFTRVGLLMY